MKKNINTLMSYGTISKQNLGIYFFFLWLILTFVTLPDTNSLIGQIMPSLIILGSLSFLFLLRILVDLVQIKKLNPNIDSPSQINGAIKYVEQLNKHAAKVSKRSRNESSYTKFLEAYNIMANYFRILLEGADKYEH